jgi:hypothetical protein
MTTGPPEAATWRSKKNGAERKRERPGNERMNSLQDIVDVLNQPANGHQNPYLKDQPRPSISPRRRTLVWWPAAFMRKLLFVGKRYALFDCGAT